MPTAAWIGIFVSIAIFLITHIIVSVWWASRVNTILELLQADFKEILVEFKSMRLNCVSKEENARDRVLIEKEFAAVWRKLDPVYAAHAADNQSSSGT